MLNARPEADPAPYRPLVLYDVAEMLEKPAPERAWLVPGLIPAHDVTLFGGDGAAGKTTLGLQLGDACARGWTWLDRKVTQGHALYYGAEDDRDDLHWRLQQITGQVLAGGYTEGAFTLITVADDDA